MNLSLPTSSLNLRRLLDLSFADHRHPDYVTYAGCPAVDHRAVLAALSPDLTAARRWHRLLVRLGAISPPVYTSRDGRTVRAQFVYSDTLQLLMNGRDDDE